MTGTPTGSDPAAGLPPLVAHVIDRLDLGGMENGLVNIINNTPPGRYRHAVVCLRDFTDFRRRIVRDDVQVHALGKRAGKDPAAYVKVWRLLRRLRPDIVHTRNLPTVEMVVPAAAAGVRCRIHGEHGRDVLEPYGGNRKYNRLRRAVSPLVSHYIAVSKDIESWLHGTIGIPAAKVTQIYNGVDAVRFHPPAAAPAGPLVIGAAGRMEEIKDHLTLVRAFLLLAARVPDPRDRLRLVIVGDGSRRAAALDLLAAEGAADLAWLPGARDDVPDQLRAMGVFVQPSINEGISNTILEAMATGLPVVATAVGGNVELVRDGATGALVPASDPAAMAAALGAYLDDPDRIARHGAAGRAAVERSYSLTAMVENYLAVYDRALAGTGGRRRA
ncbi:MAG: TIGR03088 family PEP-CTERM/XrtA system glycosyltransferase [Hyphomicrobiales bacterium]|nr:TIGR03088 family PEP-CTERM/XrtA system glycosyltransferase [Hyphomicrobiales bacterium]